MGGGELLEAFGAFSGTVGNAHDLHDAIVLADFEEDHVISDGEGADWRTSVGLVLHDLPQGEDFETLDGGENFLDEFGAIAWRI